MEAGSSGLSIRSALWLGDPHVAMWGGEEGSTEAHATQVWPHLLPSTPQLGQEGVAWMGARLPAALPGHREWSLLLQQWPHRPSRQEHPRIQRQTCRP